ncbi:MAG: SOS response-associated peptidase [Mobilitalea sp.]
MCGRYNIMFEEDDDEIMEIFQKLNEKYQNSLVKIGEVFPTDLAPIIVKEAKSVKPMLCAWGFPKFDGKGVIINARSETAFEKKTFRDSLLTRRCIIPSTGFYEWDKQKRKHLFRLEDTNALYMAGLYSIYKGEMRYVILTTNANESMEGIHDRMPLIIPKEDLETWILEDNKTNYFLHTTPPKLRATVV